MSEVADILNRAADLIEPEGAWCQGSGTKVTGGQVALCALIAISRASGSGPSMWTACGSFAEFCGGPISEWQDAPERTQAEVVAALRAAAQSVDGAS